MKKLTLFAFIMTALSAATNVLAAPARGGVCGAYPFNGADTKFDCEHLGKVTIKQIYERGWRIVSMGQQNDGGSWTYIVIEEQR
ncbi:conserved exported protein of unknown function (plasmid) [Denitratisoma oestradiolicum]|uniref:Uncharacterized protein n=1 Tax=Denitratisoma oestradiolicum TaxID=311182 RepID=A0A6S6Y6L5_9PROT|nr:hypothetical protein [Denitratisoma oestradiolicum]CAB1371180.1 conserved exported protein of unknown function [Denitratisoma oestradiolicum]CAB1371279.1 conserved exported protein of unknown function [Denitratisoma oestradiolicum]